MRSKSLLLALFLCTLCVGLLAQQHEQGILEPHLYMLKGTVEHHGATATVKADQARPLEQAIRAICEEYGWNVHYEDAPYQGRHDIADMFNPNYRATHPEVKSFPGPAGGPFQSTYPEPADTTNSRAQEEMVLNKIVSDYNQSPNPGHFAVRSLSDGSFDVVGDGIHDDIGNVVSITPILDTPISVPLDTRTFSGTIDAIMRALSEKTGVKAGGVAAGPNNLLAGGRGSFGGPAIAPARDFLFQEIARWNMTLTLLYEPPPMPHQYVIALRLAPRAKYLAFGEKKLTAALVIQPNPTRAIASIAFSPDGRTLASGSADKNVTVWNIAAGRELRTMAGNARTVVFSPDGRTLLSGGIHHAVMLWDFATGQELSSVSGECCNAASLAISPDGLTLASAGEGGRAKLWSLASGERLRVLIGHRLSLTSVAFSPDGKILASGSMDKTVKLWDVATGQELRTLVGFPDSIWTVAFSPDGRTLAAAGTGKNIMLWDVATGEQLRTLTGHSNYVTSVAFSRDGRTLASGSWDKTVKLWDVVTGRELRTLLGHADFVSSVAFSSDGHTLASGSRDTTIRLWDFKTGEELGIFAEQSAPVHNQ